MCVCVCVFFFDSGWFYFFQLHHHKNLQQFLPIINLAMFSGGTVANWVAFFLRDQPCFPRKLPLAVGFPSGVLLQTLFILIQTGCLFISKGKDGPRLHLSVTYFGRHGGCLTQVDAKVQGSLGFQCRQASAVMCWRRPSWFYCQRCALGGVGVLISFPPLTKTASLLSSLHVPLQAGT